MQEALEDAYRSIDKALDQIEDKPGVGAAVRRMQLMGSRGVIATAISVLFRGLKSTIGEGQADAARLAAKKMIRDEKNIWRLIEPNSKKRSVLKTNLIESAGRNVQVMMGRVSGEERTLSKRVYISESHVRMKVSKIVNQHLARGSSAQDLAKDVRQYFNPKTPGGVRYAALRLARTEINNAYHDQAIADIQDRPWITAARWNLSKSHPDRQPNDACDWYANTRLFQPDQVPKKPHPGCLCYVTPEIPDPSLIELSIITGQYDQWLKGNAIV